MSKLNRVCCAWGCLNTSTNNPNLSFFSLPVHEDRRTQWLTLLARDDLHGISNFTSYRVCELHFFRYSIKYHAISNRKVLNRKALPSLEPVRQEGDPCPQQHHKSTQINLPLSVVLTADASVQTDDDDQIDPDSSSTLFFRNASTLTVLKRKQTCEIYENGKIIRVNDEKLNDTFHELWDRLLTKEYFPILKRLLELQADNPDNKYDQKYKLFCLILYYTSPAAYNILQQVVGLPTPRTLNKCHVPVTTKINHTFMSIVRAKVNNMSTQEKICSVVVDSMSLKANLFYNISKDQILGFHEVDGVQTPKPANHALVVMVCGILGNWKLPVGFALVAENNNYDTVNTWIDKLIVMLHDLGLDIRAFISDLESDLLNISEDRLVTNKDPYFLVGNRKIYYIFDPPHLLNLVWNNFMSHNFHFNGSIAKWEHIVQFYENDKNKSLRLAPKLTDSHLRPSKDERTKVQLATQVLSNSVAAGLSAYIDFNIIEEPARETVEFVKKMNDLFDCLNSSSVKTSCGYKKPFSGSAAQIAFLDEMLTLFTSLRVINVSDGQIVTSRMEFIEGFQITIKSVQNLLKDLMSENFKPLMTKKLNKDVTKHFIRQIRAKNNYIKKPTSKKFVSTYEKLFLANLVKLPKQGHCSDAPTSLLPQYEHLEGILEKEPNIEWNTMDTDIMDSDTTQTNGKLENSNVICNVVCSDYNSLDMPKKCALIYLCSFLLKKSTERDKCEDLQSYISPDIMHVFKTESLRSLTNRYKKYRTFPREGLKNISIIPPDDFVNFVERMEVMFLDIITQEHKSCKIAGQMFDAIKEVSYEPPCPCFPLLYIKKLYIRTRLYYTIKFNNRLLKKNSNCLSVSL